MAEVRPIDAEELRKYVWSLSSNYLNEWDTAGVLMAIERSKTLDYSPVMLGEWVEQEDFCGDPYYTCSACKIDWVCIDGTPAENGMRYCPNCGAKMEGWKTDA